MKKFMNTPKNIMLNSKDDIETFDIEKLKESMSMFGNYDLNILLNELENISNFDVVHISRIIEAATKSFIKDEDAKQYYDKYYKDFPKFKRLRRITGYLTGDLSTWNDGKKAEEKVRVKHL